MQVSIKTLSGKALDWAVSYFQEMTDKYREEVFYNPLLVAHKDYSTNPALSFPIIKEYGITLYFSPNRLFKQWSAYLVETLKFSDEQNELEHQEDDDPLVAAMRCYVAIMNKKDMIEVPDELFLVDDE